MSVKFWASNGTVFHFARKLWVKNGPWRVVRKAWVYTGSAWKLV